MFNFYAACFKKNTNKAIQPCHTSWCIHASKLLLISRSKIVKIEEQKSMRSSYLTEWNETWAQSFLDLCKSTTDVTTTVTTSCKIQPFDTTWSTNSFLSPYLHKDFHLTKENPNRSSAEAMFDRPSCSLPPPFPEGIQMPQNQRPVEMLQGPVFLQKKWFLFIKWPKYQFLTPLVLLFLF